MSLYIEQEKLISGPKFKSNQIVTLTVFQTSILSSLPQNKIQHFIPEDNYGRSKNKWCLKNTTKYSTLHAYTHSCVNITVIFCMTEVKRMVVAVLKPHCLLLMLYIWKDCVCVEGFALPLLIWERPVACFRNFYPTSGLGPIWCLSLVL